jgi:hypothetical protein
MFDMRGTGLGGKLTTVRRPTQCRPDTGHKALCPVSIGKSLAHMNTRESTVCALNQARVGGTGPTMNCINTATSPLNSSWHWVWHC